MADSALIDDLERQFADNPRRVFARLANEYRKAGDAERAIEICRSHVPQQPGYISGHIVLGQALFDLNRYDEARSAFETALGLDPENLIALRQLGDIARDTGDLASARSWYERLLEVDPQNEEIAEQLSALDQGAAPTAESAAPDAGAVAEGESVSWGDIHPEAPQSGEEGQGGEHAAPNAHPEPANPDAAVHEEMALEGSTIEIDETFPLAPLPNVSAEVLDAPDAGMAAPPVVEGLDHGVPAVEIGGVDGSTDEPVAPPPGFEPTVVDTVAEEPEAERPTESVELAQELVIDTSALAAGDATQPAQPGENESAAEPVPIANIEAAGAAHADEPSGVIANDAGPADAFVTETMAELYVRQGLAAQALDVYRQLVRQTPDEARFQDRIVELERVVAEAESREAVATPAESDEDTMARPSRAPRTGPSIRAFLSEIAARPARSGGSGWTPDGPSDDDPADDPPTGPRSEPPVNPTTPQAKPPLDVATPSQGTPDELFPGWTAAPADEEAASALADGYGGDAGAVDGRDGVPAHRAAEALSLDAVFRGAQETNGSEPRERNVSFDEFFGGEATRNGPEPESTGEDTAADGRSAADLDLFHAWLEGLKK